MILLAEQIRRAERAQALDAAAVVPVLVEVVPGSVASARPWAGGQLVITGPGLYVNRAVAAGHGQPATEDDFATLEAVSAQAGVPAEIEVSPWVDDSIIELLSRRAYRPVSRRSILIRALGDEDVPVDSPSLDIEVVGDRAELEDWYRAALEGFGTTDAQPRQLLRHWGQALSQLAQTRLHVAFSGGAAVAVASLSAQDGVALFGGMTTVPTARRQGLQQALVAFRLASASRLGCDLAISTAEPASSSERNLGRAGFQIVGTEWNFRLDVSG